MPSLERNLKEAIDVAVEGMLALKSMKMKIPRVMAAKT